MHRVVPGQNVTKVVGFRKIQIFTYWFKKFITFSRASTEHAVLLLLDGRGSHIKNLYVINLGREYGVHTYVCDP